MTELKREANKLMKEIWKIEDNIDTKDNLIALNLGLLTITAPPTTPSKLNPAPQLNSMLTTPLFETPSNTKNLPTDTPSTPSTSTPQQLNMSVPATPGTLTPAQQTC